MTLSQYELIALDWIAQHGRTAFGDWFMPLFTNLGEKGILYVLLGVALLLFYKRNRQVGGMVLLGLTLNLLVCNGILKPLVDRPRPFALNPLAEVLVKLPTDPSFPSGHTSAAFTVAAVLLCCGLRGRWVALGFAILMGLSRLYLYVHFPTDVLWGGVVGALCGWGGVALGRRWMTSRTIKNEGLK